MAEVILFFPKINKDEGPILLPFNLLLVAAPLVKAGISVKIIDQRVDNDWRDTLIQALKSNPIIVGFTALSGKQILYALEASKVVKENSQALVVWGGVHASLLPEQTLKNEFIDVIVVGEGEKTFFDLFQRVKQNILFNDLPGLAYKKDDKILINSERKFLDLNSTPEIPYGLVNIEKYITPRSFASGRPARNISFFTSRGCPHNCGFCYNQSFNKRKWRGMSAERVVREFKRLNSEYGIDAFDLEDDEFFTDLERAKRISELILENNLKIEIFTSCRLDYLEKVDDDYIQLIKKAGFITLAFGVETGSKRMLDLTDKDITINQLFTVVERLKKFDIDSKYYFMVGFPTESVDDIYQTTDLIQKIKQINPCVRIPSWRVYTPYVGTDMWALSVKLGFRPPVSLEEWAKFEYDTINMPWLDWKMKSIILNVRFLNKYLKLDKSPGNGIFFNFAKLYGKIVNWRWKHHLFTFVPEKYLIDFILNIKKFLITKK